MSLADYHVPEFEPQADPAATVRTDRLRVTVLTPRLLRIEYAPDGSVEDRPSQLVWYRDQPVPEYTATEENGELIVETDALRATYEMGEPLSGETLTVTLRESGETYRYGGPDRTLGGALRTLDGVNGATALDPGLISRDGWTVVDDTGSLVFDGDWLADRDAHPEYRDLYVFGYGTDYRACLRDFTSITGDVPMVPRWALGNWWSRYWAYEASELRELMERFRTEGIPLSVCVVDMDWHVVDNPHHAGWTGWTWNEELFPDPGGFVEWLHDAGLRTTLNLHPAEGVHPHERQYEAMAEHVGIDPDSGTPVEFDASDPAFLRGYFEHVIHPFEDDEGVDFWWIDWQQWEDSPRLPGLDPLWALNHLHALDRTRDDRRPFVLSRWGGLGGHRSPVGFSGDAVISWESLAFQPYVTATGANAQCGWWSHDVGGHYGGTGDPDRFGELYARWAQFGSLSPVNRIHTSKQPFVDKRPWEFPPTVGEALTDALRFRHALIPYLYAMARRAHEDSIPLVRPTYYHHPEDEPAYHSPQQYYLGSELLAAPHVRPREDSTNLARRTVWLPEGTWFDARDGTRYDDGVHARYGDLSGVPLYAPAGAIVPLDAAPAFGDTDPPETLRVLAFPGDDGHVELYEDDGVSTAHRDGEFARTPIDQAWNGDGTTTVTVGPADGDLAFVPDGRDVEIAVRGVTEGATVSVEGAAIRDEGRSYDPETNTLALSLSGFDPAEAVSVTVEPRDGRLLVDVPSPAERVGELLRYFEMPAGAKTALRSAIEDATGDLDWLGQFTATLTIPQQRALAETVLDAGVDHVRHADTDQLVLWNADANPAVTYHFARFDSTGVPIDRAGGSDSGVIPEYRVIELDDLDTHDWELTVSYGDVSRVTENEG